MGVLIHWRIVATSRMSRSGAGMYHPIKTNKEKIFIQPGQPTKVVRSNFPVAASPD